MCFGNTSLVGKFTHCVEFGYWSFVIMYTCWLIIRFRTYLYNILYVCWFVQHSCHVLARCVINPVLLMILVVMGDALLRFSPHLASMWLCWHDPWLVGAGFDVCLEHSLVFLLVVAGLPLRPRNKAQDTCKTPFICETKKSQRFVFFHYKKRQKSIFFQRISPPKKKQPLLLLKSPGSWEISCDLRVLLLLTAIPGDIRKRAE